MKFLRFERSECNAITHNKYGNTRVGAHDHGVVSFASALFQKNLVTERDTFLCRVKQMRFCDAGSRAGADGAGSFPVRHAARVDDEVEKSKRGR
jgi:hypothetical protein